MESDGTDFIREQILMEMDLAGSVMNDGWQRVSGSVRLCTDAFRQFTVAWNEAACLDPTFSDADQDALLSVGITRGW